MPWRLPADSEICLFILFPYQPSIVKNKSSPKQNNSTGLEGSGVRPVVPKDGREFSFDEITSLGVRPMLYGFVRGNELVRPGPDITNWSLKRNPFATCWDT